MTETDLQAPSIRFADPDVRRCPFPAHDAIREAAPVHIDPLTGNYVMTGHGNVRKALLDFQSLRNNAGLGPSTTEKEVQEEVERLYAKRGWPPGGTLIDNDPPPHRIRLRNFRAARGADSHAWIESHVTHGPAKLWMTFDRR